MGEKIDIYKHTLDFLKENKVLMYIVVALTGGGAIGHFVPPLMTIKPVKVTVSDTRCYECAEIELRLNLLEKEVKKNTISRKDYKQTKRDFHGG